MPIEVPDGSGDAGVGAGAKSNQPVGSVLQAVPSGVDPSGESNRRLGEIIDEVLGPQVNLSSGDSFIPAGAPPILDAVLFPEAPLVPEGISVNEEPAISMVGISSPSDQLVDVQIAMGGRFSILADEDGDPEENDLPRSCSVGKRGNKLLFSNSLKYGKQAVSPPPPRNTRSRARGRGRGGFSKSESDLEGWALSKNGKFKGVHGPKAVALDALLNPQNLNA